MKTIPLWRPDAFQMHSATDTPTLCAPLEIEYNNVYGILKFVKASEHVCIPYYVLCGKSSTHQLHAKGKSNARGFM